MNSKTCTLCSSKNIDFFSKDKKREYFKCANCGIITVPEKYHLSKIDEKSRYDKHVNTPEDKRYIEFLSRVIKPTLEYVSPESYGLDFGCGPGPVLKKLFSKYKLHLEEYDLYYNDNRELLNKYWDFIIATEVIEHLKDPLQVITKLWNILKPGAPLVLMTHLYNEHIHFPSWYYKGDPTHICFFSKETFIYLSNKFDAEIYFIDKDIIILKKKQYIISKTEEKL